MTPPPDDATQPVPSPSPPAPPPPPVATPAGAASRRLTTAGGVGLVLIGASLVAIVWAVTVLGGRNADPAPPLAVVPTPTATGAEPSSGPLPSPSGSITSPSPSTGVEPEPGGIASPTPSNAPVVPLPRLAATIPGATAIRYYSIVGDRPIELIRQMERKGPRRCADEALACVRLRVEPNVTYRISPATGACTITGASPTLSAVVQLPRWTKPAQVRRVVLAWWREVFDHIAWHEGRHIQIEQRWMRKLGGMLEGKACSSAGTVIRRWARKLAAAQVRFDANDAETWTYPAFDLAR